MIVTREQLKAMIPLASKKKLDLYLEPLNQAMEEFGINQSLEVAAFIAQITHESGSLVYVEEIADGSNYEFRKDLGNLEFAALTAAHSKKTTTGKFYKGHGLIQVTGYYNHKACGEALGLDLVNEPELLCEPLAACRSAAWFWESRSLNTHAMTGNFAKITKVINGGTNGAVDRLKNYARCKKVLGC